MAEFYLFQASIGPVQSFIASARRTRDLWFGSWLLSELSRAVAQAVEEKGGSLIFPANTQADNVANKIVAKISQDPQVVGTAVKRAVTTHLHAIWQKVHDLVRGELENDSIALAQINALVECVWAAVPLDNDYAKARRRLEALIAARKTTHTFGKVTWGSDQPKSSITGQMESVIPEDRYPKSPRWESDPVRQQKILALWHNYGAGQAERLSAVDLLKRHGQVKGQDRFLSTSHIAALPFLAGLRARADNKGLQQVWRDYLAELKNQQVEIEYLGDSRQPLIGNCDGAMLFEERLDAQVTDVTSLSRAKEHLRAFLRGCKARPSPYYAILHADGDGMGAVIDHESAKGHERHREISQQLDRFATDAAKIVQDRQGASIYTGGDDVLALLPLHTALQCAKKLADTFRDFMGGFADEEGRHPTLSVGLAVVHHLTPLSDALDLSRDAEKVAKKVEGKNALAVIVSKRSGGVTTVRGQWGTFDQRMEEFIKLHHDDAIPDGAAYELRDLAERLDMPVAQRSPAFPEMIAAEAGRILKRKRTAGGTQQITQIVRDLLAQRIQGDAAIAAASGSKPNEQPNEVQRIQGGDAIAALRALADELIVARMFAGARNIVHMEKPQ